MLRLGPTGVCAVPPCLRGKRVVGAGRSLPCHSLTYPSAIPCFETRGTNDLLFFLGNGNDGDILDVSGLQMIVDGANQRALNLGPALRSRQILGAVEYEIGLL